MVVIKKIAIIFIIVILLLPNIVIATDVLIESQLETLNLSSFIQEGQKYTKDNFKDVDIGELLNSAIKGNIDTKTIYSNILKLLGKEIKDSIIVIGGILAIVVIHSILKNIGENIGKNNISQIAYYVEYILIVTLIMTSFASTMDLVKETITNLVGYANVLIPLLLALVVASGSAITATVVQPIILFIIVLIGNGITLYVLPILLISTVIGIVSNLSDKIQIGKLAKKLKSSIVWILGTTMTIFISILSLEGTLTSSVDGITIKGLKTASNTFIPIIGKTLSDSVDTVLGATSVIKNSVGIVGIIVLIGICIRPIIKLTVLTGIYNLATAIAEPIADKKIVNVLEQVAGTFKVLLAIMFCISILLIVGVAIVIRISNTGLMLG